MASKLHIAVPLVTFGVFMTEAIIHYNMGAHKNEDAPNGFVFPPKQDFLKLALVVGFFSVANGIIINQITKKL